MTQDATQTASEQPAAAKISVVVPTYNNLSLLLECIESLRGQDYPRDRVEIIVADNASTDRTRQVLTERFPYVKLLAMDSNTGFAVACNRGAAVATGAYVAFVNNDAIADKGWLTALASTIESSGETAVCVGSKIVSRDESETEFDGAASNLFGAGRPSSVWGWPDLPDLPAKGSPILFASGGAMLIKRKVFLEVGGFDPSFFAYFEDVDLGWRLWVLGYRVVYAPDAVVRHIGGATGKRSGEHRRYTLWECNSLATVIKNYEADNMEKILSAALLLQYKRAILSAGDAVKPADYRLGGPADRNVSNVERLPKVSVAHIASIDRLNAILPQIMASRREIQAKRVRSDSEILPLLGRPFEPQYAGKPYADAARALVKALNLYSITAPSVQNRVLVIGMTNDSEAMIAIAERMQPHCLIALALLGSDSESRGPGDAPYTVHNLSADDPLLARLASQADVLVSMPDCARLDVVRSATAPLVIVGEKPPGGPDHATTVESADSPLLLELCREPG